jgi:hypothetical protein
VGSGAPMAKLWRRTAARTLVGAREFSVAASAARSRWQGAVGLSATATAAERRGNVQQNNNGSPSLDWPPRRIVGKTSVSLIAVINSDVGLIHGKFA